MATRIRFRLLGVFLLRLALISASAQPLPDSVAYQTGRNRRDVQTQPMDMLDVARSVVGYCV